MGKYHAFAHRGGGIATADVLHRREAAGSLRPHPRMLFARACGRAHCTGVGAIEARILPKNMYFSTSNRSVIRSGAVPRVFTTLQQPHQGAHTAGRRTAPKRTRLHIFKFFFRFHHGNIRSLPYGSGRRGMKIALFRRPKLSFFGVRWGAPRNTGVAAGA